MKDNNRPKLGPLDIPGPSEYITISVAEYHCLTKAATVLEVILKTSGPYSDLHVTVDAARKIVADMTATAEAGAAE